jgi:hypothetical protein
VADRMMTEQQVDTMQDELKEQKLFIRAFNDDQC